MYASSLIHSIRIAVVAGLAALPGAAFAASLTPGTPIAIPHTHGKFDFIRTDTYAHRLLLGHEGNGSFDLFDLDARSVLAVVPTGTAQDAAVDVGRHRYYVSGNNPGRTVIVDARSFAILGQVALPADTDLIAYDAATRLIHESNDTAPEEWLIDPATRAVVSTLRFKGHGVEDLVFSPRYRRLFQAVKGSNTIAEIDPTTQSVLAQWSLAPDKNPHGIALDPAADRLIVACAGILVLMNASNGAIVARAPIAEGVDEIAYDASRHTVYCASRKGLISVVRIAGDTLVPKGDVSDAKTGSITVDPTTHLVWIAYGNKSGAWVQPFTPAS